MVVGNVLGSNIFNVFFTLGVTAIFQPVPLDLALNLSVIANVIVTLLLVLFTWFARRKTMGRAIGVLLVTAYVGYIVHALII
jgi:cation:H+ antiporter